MNLIAVFRIKTYEDFDNNVPLMGLSIDVFHFMGKNKSGFVGNRHPYFPQTLSGFSTFTCINESLSLDQSGSRNTFYLRRGGNGLLTANKCEPA